MTLKPRPASDVPAAAPTTQRKGTAKRPSAKQTEKPPAKSPSKPPKTAKTVQERKSERSLVPIASKAMPPKDQDASQPDILSMLPLETHTPGTPQPLKRGRKSSYDRATGELVLARIANGELLNRIGEEVGMPTAAAVRSWVISDVDGFAARYAHARELGWHWHGEEILELSNKCRVGAKVKTSADGVEIQTADMVDRTRLQIDARKWVLSKMLPKVYGDKVNVDANVQLSVADELKALALAVVPAHAPLRRDD
jgi:hypothetical protein